MQKTLLAMVIAACAGAAHAQSSVTISGYIDIGLYKPTGTNSVRIDSVNANSALKFSGVEDLGGGLKATFMLENKFSPESGGFDGTTNGRPLFQGESTVGLSGDFGAVRVGRAVTPAGLLLSLADPWRNTRLGSASVAAGYGVNIGADKRDGAGLARTDGIFYNSPNVNGFSGFATFGLKNTNSGGANYQGEQNMFGLGLSYADAKLGASVVLENNREKGDVKAGFVSYDFGFMKARFGAGEYKNTAIADKKRSWVASASFPVTSNVNVHGVYGQEKNRTTDVKTMDRFGLGADYILSKRTSLYLTASNDKAVATGSKTAWDMGIKHSF